MRSIRSLRLQLLFRALFTVGLVTLVMIDVFVLQNNNDVDNTNENTTMNNSGSKPSIVHTKEIQQDLEDGSKRGDLSYVGSKRKVPRGPDPIHNRRARNSRRTPGRA